MVSICHCNDLIFDLTPEICKCIQHLLKLNRQFFGLVNKFFKPLLNPCLLPFHLDLSFWFASILTLNSQPVVIPSPPSIPLPDLSATLRELLCASSVLLCSIFFIKLARMFSELSPDFLDLFLAKERRRTRSPKELLEAISRLVQKLLTLKVPNRKPWLRLQNQVKSMK